MKRASLILTAALSACATAPAKTSPASTTSAPATGDLTVPESELPNGVMKSCRIVKRDIEVAGKQVLLVEGGAGIFIFPLPEASDWVFQCDDAQPFWAFSKSKRMQATVTPHRVKPDDDLSPRNYLTTIGTNVKANATSVGVRVSGVNVSQISTGDQSQVFSLEMTLDAPEGRQVPLFPQNTFYSARQLAKDVMLDVHVTTYPRDGSERAAMRTTARVVMGSFTVNGTLE